MGLLIAACNGNAKNDLNDSSIGSKTIMVKLADSLGTVNVSLPDRYDTSFSWTHTSDCGKPCDKIKYRFQPKALPIFRESGFYFYPLKDSIDQFTISHSGYISLSHENADSSGIFVYHQVKKASAVADPETNKIKSDTVEKIGDHYFSIITIEKYDSLKFQYSKKILASTYFKGNEINFNYELLTKEKNAVNSNFVARSMQSLRSIHLYNP
jgi:hypothetical protein